MAEKIEAKKESEPPPVEAEHKQVYFESAQKHFGPYENGKNWDFEYDKRQEKWYFYPYPAEEREERLKEKYAIQDLQEGFDRTPSGKQESFMKKNLDEICQEYKIHLQPKVEYGPKGERINDRREMCADKLLEAVSKNSELKDLINCCKVSTSGKEQKQKGNAEVVPEVVIYPREGRENFEKVLTGILREFKGFEKYGSGIAPRYNYEVNKLVYVAQSGGDFKNRLSRRGILDKYFNEKFNYAFRKGEKPPDKEEPKTKAEMKKEWREQFGPLAEVQLEKEKTERADSRREKEWEKQFGALAEVQKLREQMEKAEIPKTGMKTEEILKEAGIQKPAESFEELQRRLEERLEKTRVGEGRKLSLAEKNSDARNFYLGELGYSVKYDFSHSKARLLDGEGKYITDEKGKPIDFKTAWNLETEKSPMRDFLREKLKEKLEQKPVAGKTDEEKWEEGRKKAVKEIKNAQEAREGSLEIPSFLGIKKLTKEEILELKNSSQKETEEAVKNLDKMSKKAKILRFLEFWNRSKKEKNI